MSETNLQSEVFARIDDILLRAHRDKRRHLLEHEVYEILEIAGLRAPRHRFVLRGRDVREGDLAAFVTEDLVVKVVSDDILHKSRVGGVRWVPCEPDAVNALMREMEEAVPRHPSFSKPPVILGFLLVESVDYSEALGNESLIGFKENLAFGPVLSFSKGGSDAEHFAKHYSSPNVKAVPLSLEDCRRLIEETQIYIKYRETGKTSRVDVLADALWRMGQIAHHFSGFNPEKPRFVFTEFEMNPVVFDAEENLLAIDGLASFVENAGLDPDAARYDVSQLAAFFRPRGMAIVGVSAGDPGKMGNIIADLQVKAGRTDLSFLNVKGGETTIRGRTFPLYRNLAEVPGPVDLVVVAVPAPLTPPVVDDCIQKKVKAIILIPGGFGEVSGDHSLEDEIRRKLAGTGIRVVGPNCLGVIYQPETGEPGINTFFIPEEKLDFRVSPRANTALITQSGAMGVTLLDQPRTAPCLRAIVSYGNQIDVDPGDLVAHFETDPLVRAMAVYVEGFQPAGGRAFFDAARVSTKPIIVYKAGRTDAGSRAAASHTASMTGDYEVAKAAFLQAGLIVTDRIVDLSDLLRTFALLGDRAVGGRRVAGIVNAGFESTYAADSIGNLELARFTVTTASDLRSLLPPIVGIHSFLDLTPMANDALFEATIERVLVDPNVDSLFISIVPHAITLSTVRKEMETRKENLATRIIRRMEQSRKPIVVSVCAGDMYDLFVSTLEEGGVPTYPTAERAMACLNALTEWKLARI